MRLWHATRARRSVLLDRVNAEAEDKNRLLAALDGLHECVQQTYGSLASEGPVVDLPPGWEVSRLRASGSATLPLNEHTVGTLSVTPGAMGDVDGFSFDLQSTGRNERAAVLRSTRRAMLPAHVRFRGMPNARFWDFENGDADFGAVAVDNRDVARLTVIEFALTASNDWFMLAQEQQVGSAMWVDETIVRDVFGGTTLVPRAESHEGAAGGRVHWTMFTVSIASSVDAEVGSRPFLLLAPGLPTRQAGAVLEDVRFLRDETANMSWAIERTVSNALGVPWRAHEREMAQRPGGVPAPPSLPNAGPALEYRLQTQVPSFWAPLIPVQIPGGLGQIELVLGVLRDANSGARLQSAQTGQVLRSGGERLVIREEELPRAGARVQRVPVRARLFDGSTRVWMEWRRSAGAGEGSSGLRFDCVQWRSAAQKSDE